eukprot:6179947-Pleurochrysis_carterae.AAC.1
MFPAESEENCQIREESGPENGKEVEGGPTEGQSRRVSKVRERRERRQVPRELSDTRENRESSMAPAACARELLWRR